MPVEIDPAECDPFLYQQNDESKFKNNFILLKFIPYIFQAFLNLIRHSHGQRSTHILHFGLILFLAFLALIVAHVGLYLDPLGSCRGRRLCA